MLGGIIASVGGLVMEARVWVRRVSRRIRAATVRPHEGVAAATTKISYAGSPSVYRRRSEPKNRPPNQEIRSWLPTP